MVARATTPKKLALELEIVRQIARDPEIVTKELARLMRKNAPVLTGHLRSTVYHNHNVAGAKAGYAGFVELMGDEYEYANQSIRDFKMSQYADKVMGGFK